MSQIIIILFPVYILTISVLLFAGGFALDGLSTKLLMTAEYVESNQTFAALLEKHSFTAALGYELVTNDLIKVAIVAGILLLGPLWALTNLVTSLSFSFVTALAIGFAIAGSAHLDAAYKNVVGR
jgi:hypothetical protein